MKKLTGIVSFLFTFGLYGDYVQAQESPALFVSRANARIAKASGFKNKWDGPTTGPKIAAKQRRIVMITSDMRNPSLMTLQRGLREAIGVAGWELIVMDTWSMPNKRGDAFSRALALKPDGIVLAGIDAKDQQKEIGIAAKANIPIVGWHASLKIGPTDGLFTNLGTEPKDVAQTAALLAALESNGKAGVVIFTDPSSLYMVAKSNEIADTIKLCQSCSLLGMEEMPLISANDKMAASAANLYKVHGKKWTHTIVVNDLYLDAMTTPAVENALADSKMQGISAGDGSDSAYKRIRNKKLQIGTIPEPLQQQGWQLVDELNRALSNEKPSLYSSQAYVVTNQNMVYHGGQSNTFDPDTGYRNEYKKIWGK